MLRMLSTTLLSLAILGLAIPSRGQESDESKQAMDARISRSVQKTISVGYRLYNDEHDPAGCYRVYQGSLLALSPILDYRADLKGMVDQALVNVTTMPTYNDRAFALRKVLDKLYEATTPSKPLWDRLGGQPAVGAVVHDFVALAAGDPKVDFLRGGKYKIDAAGVADLEKKLVELISATTGGPLKYSGKDMKSAHAGMAITEAQFNALASDLIAVLDKYRVPKREKDELIAIVAGTKKDIVEVGSAPAAPTAAAPPPAPMPEKAPLWDRLGGETAVKAVVHDFVAKAAADPKVDFTRGGKYKIDEAGVANLEKLLVQLISATTGGPLKYEGRDMKESHKGMGITDEQFGAIAADLIDVLKKYKVPQKEIDELIGVIATTKKDIVEAK